MVEYRWFKRRLIGDRSGLWGSGIDTTYSKGNEYEKNSFRNPIDGYCSRWLHRNQQRPRWLRHDDGLLPSDGMQSADFVAWLEHKWLLRDIV